jgi:acetolactate synthase-1/2/3 large subunit
MKTSDYIAHRIKKEADTVFGVTGGNIVNVVDSFKRAGMNIVSMHHEQSASIAADAYARFKKLGVCYSTSGPGVTNLLTGTCCSYFDSIPVLTLGGQVPTHFLDGVDRQMGFQEVDGVSIFKPATKLSRRYKNIDDLELCIHTAQKPRKGPTFLEIPDNTQRENVTIGLNQSSSASMNVAIIDFPDISRFKKPLLIVGYGAYDMPLEIEMPFLYTWRTKDKFYHHKFCKGGFGITGDSAGNKLLKEADVVILLGTRIDSHQAPQWSKFAPNAYKIAIGLEFPHRVDEWIDCELSFNLKLQADDWCARVKEDTPIFPMYQWVDEVSSQANEKDIIIPDMGQAGCIVLQRWRLKEGQRMFNGMNHSPMGYAIPASIGAHLATGRRIIVIVGDGSLMMNLQELQTISDLKLPINIFVINNHGYGMIRQTQSDWRDFLLQNVGCNFNIPAIKKLADAFNLKYSDTLSDKPSICGINFNDTRIFPKWKYGEDL